MKIHVKTEPESYFNHLKKEGYTWCMLRNLGCKSRMSSFMKYTEVSLFLSLAKN